MYKNLIKSYAMKIKPEDVIDYGRKEGVNVSLEEATLFVDTVKENADYILDGHAYEILESIKDKVSAPSYEKLEELLMKYQKYIN